LYCALILYECILEALDKKIPIHVAFLDAKAVFDVVGHTNLYRKLFLSGVRGKLWLLTYHLSQGAETSVKWQGIAMDPFAVSQDVRQGGVLSTDLYKLYINPLLDQIEDIGMQIGTIPCSAPTCANDVSLIADSEQKLQILIDTVVNYSKQENYKLQPAKSAVMSFNTNMENPGYDHTINIESIQKPNTIVHLGITHHRNYWKTTSTQIQENMEKSRHTLHSLLGAGLHGKNGLNPTACLHLLQVYPIQTYGLEILLPSRTELQTLEIFYPKILKQILSIPTNTADPAVYILAGMIPIESRIHAGQQIQLKGK
jgi:hypothetical protein